MSRPSTYDRATKLSAEAQSCLDFARLVWLDLTPAMQEALREASIDVGLLTLNGASKRTAEALESRGLTRGPASAWLTPLGSLVREAGIKSRIPE